ncbi:biotin--[acetyl-CoA-carboxylase] ligase [Parapusillimonas granuli]|uniref:biotin--[biotin carboxyl-carrier protein] ligase n=1 Tax=Parapusillimonas granuli TaxID=380911 RepID=A0A853G4B9_9BURK|nr:biotin--[acetyl-CoA-carboxylase] ligase [Parapusillimonas granuli]MBB5215483.1 BirA family biotin operon repressor/biotin-[acetyl-CoA-carboxylase] ligase [Parapusillimonas granuli]MEB2400320.1 biotin--[acetyl-CoA-carboxylase] ligase [Alcaligenaceae bacterium]NYT49850.1 biotin--[acetyl-CoA-carboxylase] ligase [Parapusillimonas granuli]
MNTQAPSFLPDPEPLQAELRSCLPQFKQVLWVEQTDSTNADLLSRARAPQGPLARPWLLGAHLQNRGRGRAGRSWQNRRGANLMFSCAFDLFLPAHQLPTLSPLVGLAACVAMRGLLDPANRPLLTMKWPNDLLWKSAKLAGILVEATRAGTSRLAPDHYVAIIGMGVNLDDARSLSQSLNRQVADWSEIAREDAAAQAVSACAMVAALAQAWYDSLNQVTAYGFGSLPERYAQVDALAGRRIDVLDGGRLLHAGIACGVDTQGRLILRSPEGETAVSVGEVSVRPQSEAR